MSVINSVLRDLDSKPSAFAPLEVDAVRNSVTNDSRSIRYWWGAILLIFVAIIFYASGAVDFLHRDQVIQPVKSFSDKQESTADLQHSAAPAVDSQQIMDPVTEINEVMSNQITGLQIGETAEFMQLEFQLTEFAPSYLKQRSNNRYVFIIKKVANAISTPFIADSPWLKQIQISAIDSDIEIRFDTQPGVLVDTQERRDESAYYWLIRLKKNLVVEKVEQAVMPAKDSTLKKTGGEQSTPQVRTAIQQQPEERIEPDEQITAVKLQIRPVQNKPTDQMKLNTAIESAKQGDLVAARLSLQQLLGSQLDRSARTHLLSILHAQKEQQEFGVLLNSSLEKYPDDRVFQLYEANQLFAEQKYQSIIDKFKQVTDNQQMISLLATSYQRTEQHQLAAEYFALALKMNAQQPRLWIGLAISQQYLSQREQALSSYQMALRSGAISERLHGFVQTKIKQLSN